METDRLILFLERQVRELRIKMRKEADQSIRQSMEYDVKLLLEGIADLKAIAGMDGGAAGNEATEAKLAESRELAEAYRIELQRLKAYTAREIKQLQDLLNHFEFNAPERKRTPEPEKWQKVLAGADVMDARLLQVICKFVAPHMAVTVEEMYASSGTGLATDARHLAMQLLAYYNQDKALLLFRMMVSKGEKPIGSQTYTGIRAKYPLAWTRCLSDVQVALGHDQWNLELAVDLPRMEARHAD